MLTIEILKKVKKNLPILKFRKLNLFALNETFWKLRFTGALFGKKCFFPCFCPDVLLKTVNFVGLITKLFRASRIISSLSLEELDVNESLLWQHFNGLDVLIRSSFVFISRRFKLINSRCEIKDACSSQKLQQ